MKKKMFATLLMAVALVVAPVGGQLATYAASLTGNNTVPSLTGNNTVPSQTGNNTVPGTSGSAGNTTSSNTASSGSSNEQAYVGDLVAQISAAEEGATVRFTGVQTLSKSVLLQLMERSDVTLVLEYTYQEQDYVVTIPAGTAFVEDDINWYGPLYLALHYGNSASSYVVKSGDTMSKIAAQHGITLRELAAKNHQIADVNRIRVGQKITIR